MGSFISYISALRHTFSGDIYTDHATLVLYSTDASVYKEMPKAVAMPKTESDVIALVKFAKAHNTFLIPRTAGTSLGGQVVGSGIVIDFSKYFNQILEINTEEQWVWVQPGVIRDDLNKFLHPYGFLFGPETSTANRAMIGGMVGNNSCGTNSIVYGTTRQHVIATQNILSDGSKTVFAAITPDSLQHYKQKSGIEGDIYTFIDAKLSNPAIHHNILDKYPKASIHRRNTGYALDELCKMNPYNEKGQPLNLNALLCGSEGTLAITTAIQLNIVPLPPKEKVVVAVHFTSLQESLQAVVSAMDYHPTACELMDKIILDCTKENIEQSKNRSFIHGDPEAVLCIEFHDNTKDAVYAKAEKLITTLKGNGYGYHYPIIYGTETKKIWDLRKAGLGLLANIPGDKKAVANIEDTAVDVHELPAYIADFTAMMESHGQQSVYYAHAGAGELHLRPLLDLKDIGDRKMFRKIAEETAQLVKKYNGSLSGEHGDGRVRGEFIPWMIGEENYQLLKELKATFDPNNLLNPGKITDTPPMDKFLRYEENQKTPEYPETIFDFSSYGGILRLAEKCNGSGDCRKSQLSGGTLCPSYMATRDEKDTTRARANMLRTILSDPGQVNAFDSKDAKDVLDLCISCKGCTSECPSNVDMAALKAEFTYQYHKNHRPNIRSMVFGHIGTLSGIAMVMPGISNFFLKNPFSSKILKAILSVAQERQIPDYHHETLREWWENNHLHYANEAHKNILLFADEFTNYNDVNVGIITCKLLYKLGYNVLIVAHEDSGRALLSKGWVAEAQDCAIANVNIFKDIVSLEIPLLGIEPSAILTFRDEYLRLVPSTLLPAAKAIAVHTYTVEEFLFQKISEGHLSPTFTTKRRKILLHGHCHQKALSNVSSTAFLLSLPQNYDVETIASGCCGMAGSFGYEKEHYSVSKAISELVLIPKINEESTHNDIVAAPGTSCRHQIEDFSSTKAQHPLEIFYESIL